MPAPVVIKLAIAGEKEVTAAFDSVVARARKINDQVANDTIKTTERRVRAVRQGADREAKELERLAAKAQKEELKKLQAAERSAKRAADIQSKEAQRAAKEYEQAERQKTRAAERESQQRANAERRAQAAIAAESRRSASKVAQPFGRAARSTIGTVSGLAAGVGIAGGTMAIGSALMSNIQLKEQAALLVNATRSRTGEATQTQAGLIGEAQGLGSKYGIDSTEMMGAMSTVAARAGGAEGLTAFRKDLEDITKTSVAFGVSMHDMGGVVAAALKAGVQPGEEMRSLIQDIAAMGKEGSIEVSDLASELARLGGIGKMTEMSKGQMLRRQVGLAQIAADAAVSPEQSRTAVIDVIRDINTHAGALKKAGVQVYGKNNLINDPATIIAQAMDAAMTKGISVRGKGLVKGSEALSGIFTGTSMQVVSSLMADYNKGGKQGVINRITDASGAKLGEGERDKGLAEVMGTESMKLKQNVEAFKAKMGELLPRFAELIPKIVQVTEGFAKLAVWAANNPFTALGGIFAGYLAKELAAVGLSKMFQTGIAGIMRQQGATGFGGGIGVAGNLSAAATIAMTAGTVYLAGTKIIDELDEQKKREGKGQFKTVSEAENLLSHVELKGASEEDRKKAAILASSLKGQQEASQGVELPSQLKYLAAVPALAPVVGAVHGGVAAYNKFTAASREAGAGGTTDQIPGLVEALTKLASASDNLNRASDKIATASLSSPDNAARQGAPAGMGH